MKIEFSLHNALPQLVIEQREDGWYARVEFDWTDSYEGTVWPSALLDEDGKLPDGTFPDWVKARGTVGALGAAAANMDFPESIDLGPVPSTWVGFYGGDDSAPLAQRSEADAIDWSRGYDNSHDPMTMHVEPDKLTAEQVEASLRLSAGIAPHHNRVTITLDTLASDELAETIADEAARTLGETYCDVLASDPATRIERA